MIVNWSQTCPGRKKNGQLLSFNGGVGRECTGARAAVCLVMPLGASHKAQTHMMIKSDAAALNPGMIPKIST